MITEFVWPMESCRKGAKYLVQWIQAENSPMMCLISKDNMSRYVSLASTHMVHTLVIYFLDRMFCKDAPSNGDSITDT